MKKILLTGFEPFDGDATNPSMDLVHFYQMQKSRHEMSFEVLPVTFKDSYEIIAKLSKENAYDFIIMTGVAKNRSKITLEKVGINWIDARIPDNAGQIIKTSKINFDKREGIFSSLSLEKMILERNDPNIEISYSAGSYVCNYVYFQTLSNLSTSSLFIHLPGTHELTQGATALKNNEVFNSIFNFIELSF